MVLSSSGNAEPKNIRERSFESPLSSRYASDQMLTVFSPLAKYTNWRRLWIALAEAEQKFGLSITDEQITELKNKLNEIDFDRAAELEKKLHHDVMAHIHCYGEQCPLAKPIIHLGATSCYVTDNGDLLQIHEAIQLIIQKLKIVLTQLDKFASKNQNVPCLAFTHFQPAQLTTVGKRACLWAQDFLLDLSDLEYRLRTMKFLGLKGTTGTQASFLALFDGNADKVQALDQEVATRMGFTQVFIISGQTYTRKQDTQILEALAGIAGSAHKFATDLRLLAHLRELEEPFGEHQVGSSAMPHKRNPILAERICGLSRYVISLLENPHYTAATQWLERSLDDSSNRRLSIPESFLATDAILELLLQLTKDIVVNEKIISRNVQEELPFLSTENLLMLSVKKGGDRQDLHEKLRQHSFAASDRMKNGDGVNDLLYRIENDKAFSFTKEELSNTLKSELYVGLAPQQVQEFLEKELRPSLNEVNK